MSIKRATIKGLALALGAMASVAALLELAFLVAPDVVFLKFGAPEQAVGIKSGTVSANFNAISRIPDVYLRSVEFKGNDGPWHDVDGASPRLGKDQRIFEVDAGLLADGENRLSVRFRSFWGSERTLTHAFVYHDQAPDFPISIDWTTAPEVQDGFWEVIEDPILGRVARPVPGSEGYDRLALISHPFEGGRRVNIDVRFVTATGDLFGFGLVPFWGGHLDDGTHFPRRGWEYGIAWYYSQGEGLGVEFSNKQGPDPHTTHGNYIPFTPVPGEIYRLESEATSSGGVTAMRVRIKRLPDGDFSDWVTLADKDGLLTGESHAVAIVAHRAQVEFGPASVEKFGAASFEN